MHIHNLQPGDLLDVLNKLKTAGGSELHPLPSFLSRLNPYLLLIHKVPNVALGCQTLVLWINGVIPPLYPKKTLPENILSTHVCLNDMPILSLVEISPNLVLHSLS